MSDVVSLDEARAERNPEWLTCVCGSHTFILVRRPSDPDGFDHGALVLRPNGSVLTYIGEPRCADCGRPAEASA